MAKRQTESERRHDEIVGVPIERWTPIRYIRAKDAWLCRCVCGKEKTIPWCNLKHRLSKSCGCLGQENRKRKIEEYRRKRKLKEQGFYPKGRV
jgi:CDGSH-type Zn-finger protein